MNHTRWIIGEFGDALLCESIGPVKENAKDCEMQETIHDSLEAVERLPSAAVRDRHSS